MLQVVDALNVAKADHGIGVWEKLNMHGLPHAHVCIPTSEEAMHACEHACLEQPAAPKWQSLNQEGIRGGLRAAGPT